MAEDTGPVTGGGGLRVSRTGITKLQDKGKLGKLGKFRDNKTLGKFHDNKTRVTPEKNAQPCTAISGLLAVISKV